MPKKCLMLETKDHRKFFTHEKNYPLLVEFGKTFGAEISVVLVEKPEILDLITLAPAICDSSYEVQNPPILEVVEVKLTRTKRQRKTLRRQATTVKKWIKDQLLAGNIVKLAEVKKKYQRYKLTLQAYSNHLREIRRDLATQGFQVDRVGHGMYKATR
jgi:hypothetical protein